MDIGEPDEGDEVAGAPFRTPPPPDDRLWRHPSEIGWVQRSTARRPQWPMALAWSLAGSILTLAVLGAMGSFDDAPAARRQAVIREAVRPAGGKVDPNSVVALAAEVRPSIVRLEITGAHDTSVGSGVMFRDDGAIITSAHVVEGARRISVELADGRKLPGRVTGVDVESDIAVVRVDDDAPFAVAIFGSIDGLEVGEPAVAIGSPLGLEGPASVTTGVISALGRQLTVGKQRALRDLIQTDAIIAPGSSGGALLDGEGVVIGITTAYATDGAGSDRLGFATPVDIARSVAIDLLAGREIVHPWLGIGGNDRHGGAYVVEVSAGGPADAAGVRAGDVIIDLDDHPVDNMSALRVVLRSHHPAERLTLRYMRDGRERVTEVQLVATPKP